MTEQSRLQVEEREGISVITFTDPTVLNAYHINEIAKELIALVEKQQRYRLIIDLKPIKMLSSQSLGVFLNLRKKLDEVDGKLVISGIDPQLYRVFKITNLKEIFDFYDDVDTAVQNFDK